jgi:hypothetical protein
MPTSTTAPAVVTSTGPSSSSLAPLIVERYSMCDLMSKINYASVLPQWIASPIGNSEIQNGTYYSPVPIEGEWIANEIENAKRGSFCFSIFQLESPGGATGVAEVRISTRNTGQKASVNDNGDSSEKVSVAGVNEPVWQSVSKSFQGNRNPFSTCQFRVDSDHGMISAFTKISLTANEGGEDPNEYLVACSSSEILLRLAMARMHAGLVKLIPVPSSSQT